jgi:hypothetical protein
MPRSDGKMAKEDMTTWSLVIKLWTTRDDQ